MQSREKDQKDVRQERKSFVKTITELKTDSYT